MNNLPDPKNRRVLVIDDNHAIHDDFRKILSPGKPTQSAVDASEMALFGSSASTVSRGGPPQFEVDSAYQGQEGMMLVKKAVAEGRPYAMAFVDVRMPPGWDGIETTQRIWENDPDIQIVICTAYSDYSWSQIHEKIGNCDRLLILKKPFDAVEASQLAQALTEKWWLHQQSQRKMEELESRVAERTSELQQTNSALQTEVAEHTRAEEALRLKTAFFEAQVNSSLDGILVVDQDRKTSLQNQRFVDLFKMPQNLAYTEADEIRLLWVTDIVKNPEQFVQKVRYLYANPNEISRDEVELNDGTTLDRYSFPALGKDGKYYGRVWTYRDMTARKRTEESLRLLESAVEQSTESIVITDADINLPGPKIIFVNPAFTKMTGYTAGEAIGKTPRILQGPRSDKTTLARLRKNLEQGEVFAGETINYRKDGTEFDVEWQIAPIRNAGGKTTHFVAIQRDISKRKKAENALSESNEKFRQLAENINDVFWMTSPDLKQVHYVSPAYARVWGRSMANASERPQEWSDAILPEDQEHVFATFSRLMADEPSVSVEFRIARPDGEVRWIHSRGFQVKDAAGKVIRLTGIASDITERKRLEAHLFQSQKMETVGKLAGGIAHEFNSILTAIIGQSELLLGDLPPESRLVKNAIEIHRAADRAAILTRQLLAYGRKQILLPEFLDLNLVLAGMESTLKHLVGRSVDVRIAPGAGLKAVRMDPGQIEQVIVNIAMNAAAVMPSGGKLTLETANVTLDQDYVSQFTDLKAGEYVMLAITDTGTGISPETKKHLFEPFFTTKGVGQGTGLGLATCFGILKQSGGHINVYSELSRGATFKIYMPQVEVRLAIPASHPDPAQLPRGTETILLVEDDPALREMATTLLTRLGYTVLAAADGLQALSLKHQRGAAHVDLLFTDVVMPHMSGKELADRVQSLYPQTRILFTSAYTENAIVHQGVLNPGVALLQKPFTPSALARKVREVLDWHD